MTDHIRELINAQQETSEHIRKLTECIPRQQSTAYLKTSEVSFIDTAMKVGIALCVAGILYVASTLQAVQIQSAATTATLVSVKDSITALTDKYEKTESKSKEVFLSEIQPYALRIQATELSSRENKETIQQTRDALASIKSAVAQLTTAQGVH
jgi:hypothetical protein